VKLAINPPLEPMLAKRLEKLPDGEQWLFEPKWDGFRALVFRDGDDILIQSREQKSLNRYFPELVHSLLNQLPERCVLDGEIVIARNGALDFEALQLRIHPAASRVKILAQSTPASMVFFDCLLHGNKILMDKPFELRREMLTKILKDCSPPLHLTPASRDRRVAADWFRRFEGAGLDGVMAKPLAGIYEPGKRTTFKVKHERDCDCVVAGFRWYKSSEEEAVGSLLLGLFDKSGALQHVGVCASFTKEKRSELLSLLSPYRTRAATHHPWLSKSSDLTSDRIPGGASRWSAGKDLSWQPLRPELVVEVAYEHMEGLRFRHMAHFRRWRPDKSPEECTYDQLEVVPAQELQDIFASGH
jgi:ATP-dependent DNA ligase